MVGYIAVGTVVVSNSAYCGKGGEISICFLMTGDIIDYGTVEGGGEVGIICSLAGFNTALGCYGKVIA